MHSPRQLADPPSISAGTAPGPATLGGIVATALACFAAGQAGITFRLEEIFFSPFWPLSGVAAGCILLGGPLMATGVYSGIAAHNLMAGLPPLTTWIGPLGIVVEALLAYGILRTILGARPRLNDLRGCFAFLFFAPWVPALINGIFGFGLLFADQAAVMDHFWREFGVFVLANGSSIALLAPAFVVWSAPPDAAWWRRAAVLGPLTFAAAWLVLSGSDWPPYLLLLPMLAAAVVLGLRGTAPLTALVTCTGMFFLQREMVPFGNYLQLYLFLAVMALCSLSVAAVVGQLRRRLEQMSRGAESAGLSFWKWDSKSGLSFWRAGDGCLLAADENRPRSTVSLFDASQDRGTMETTLDRRPALSFWQAGRRSPQGEPETVDGVVLDLSERLSLEQARRQAWQSEVELRNLRSSLAPHLLFNCLAAVRGIVRTDPERARSFIDHLSRFLRDSTDAQTRETIPLLDEWQLCEDFLALQALRFERDLPRLVEIEGPAYHARIPPMILLNLVENAVKHGVVDQSHPLVVAARLEDGCLEAVVRNHGRLGPMPRHRPGGLGMARGRLQAVYGESAKLDIASHGEEVVASLRIPAHTAS